MMKTNRLAIFTFIIVVLSIFSCNDDYLNREPLDAISDKSFFSQPGDLRSYMNGMYNETILRRDTVILLRWNDLANGTDDYVTSTPAGSLNTRNISGRASQTNSTWNNQYNNIRKINYFLKNAYRVSPLNSNARHYIGEGYFCRAFYYYKLLINFGGVPYIDIVLETNSEELYNPRDSRDYIAEKIIENLDSAIINLDWKGAGEAGAGRINKDAALVLKTRVGLYEGSWEKYHGEKNTPFSVEGKDGTNFLQKAVEAGEMLISKHGSNIYIGSPGNEYNELFQIKDYSKTEGAFLYRVYSRAHSIIHDWHGGSVAGWEAGVTKGLVDQYLMNDGKPESISSKSIGEPKMNSLVENKDPRLGQTIWYPAKGTFKENFPNTEHPDVYSTSMPGLVNSQQRRPTPTGYRIWKGVIIDPNEWRNGETDDLIIRYAEGLLNYAEAKSLLGTLTQNDIEQTINVIRSRVGMPQMIIGEVNSWDITYKASDGYDISATNIINEIRRERRIELCLEGFRIDDIKRWALMDEVFNGQKPEGAYLQEFLDYWNNPEAILADGFTFKDPSQVVLTVGVNVEPFDDGFINPFWRHADFKITGTGYYIDPERDYLNAIPDKEIELYKTKGGVTLEQNPGWF